MLVDAGKREHVDRSLFVGNVQQTPDPVNRDRRRPTSESSSPRQHRAAAVVAAPAPAVRVHPVELLVVQVGDEHVAGSGVDRNGAREERTLVAAGRRRTPSPQRTSSVGRQTRHLATVNNLVTTSFRDGLGRLAAWHLPGGPDGPASRWAATSKVEVGQTT